jgi:hypothetical protein
MQRERPELSEYQLDCLRSFLRFEFPIAALHSVLVPLITFKLDGPTTHQTVHYSAGIPKNPIKVAPEDIGSAIERSKTGEIMHSQLQQWATMVLLNDAFDWSGEHEERIAEMLNALSSAEGLAP